MQVTTANNSQILHFDSPDLFLGLLVPGHTARPCLPLGHSKTADLETGGLQTFALHSPLGCKLEIHHINVSINCVNNNIKATNILAIRRAEAFQ